MKNNLLRLPLPLLLFFFGCRFGVERFLFAFSHLFVNHRCCGCYFAIRFCFVLLCVPVCLHVRVFVELASRNVFIYGLVWRCIVMRWELTMGVVFSFAVQMACGAVVDFSFCFLQKVVIFIVGVTRYCRWAYLFHSLLISHFLLYSFCCLPLHDCDGFLLLLLLPWRYCGCHFRRSCWMLYCSSCLLMFDDENGKRKTFKHTHTQRRKRAYALWYVQIWLIDTADRMERIALWTKSTTDSYRNNNNNNKTEIHSIRENWRKGDNKHTHSQTYTYTHTQHSYTYTRRINSLLGDNSKLIQYTEFGFLGDTEMLETSWKENEKLCAPSYVHGIV